jgi:RNA polymerase sigma factor (TIGR02999 family)
MPTDEVTQLLQAWTEGDAAALEKLIPLVDSELQRLAHALLSREHPGHGLETTALINEALLRLVDSPPREWQSRRQFFAIAARLMRQVLIDHARKELRRTGGAKHISAMSVASLPTKMNEELLALDEALNRLATMDERKSRVVELRYFGGLTIEETAAVLDLPSATVEREWRFAKAWLKRELVVAIPSQMNASTITQQSAGIFLTTDAEQKLAEAWSNRELVSTLISENWAALKLLVQLRLSPNVTKRQLVSALEIDADIVNSLLLKLDSFGAVEKQEEVFSITKRGYVLLENFEKAIGNSFNE